MTVPFPPVVLVAVAVALLAVLWLVAGLADRVTPTPWPRATGHADRDERGRDARLEHLVRLLHASTPAEAHRTVVDLVERRLEQTQQQPDPELSALLGHPPIADRDAYLTWLDAALDRIERL
jgi:hypothetical protein